VGNLFRIQTTWSGVPGDTALSTHYFGTGFYVADGAASSVVTFWTALDEHINENVSWAVLGDVAVIDEVTGIIDHWETAATADSGAGTNNGDPLPWANQGLIHWATGEVVNGHQVTGRTFVPGLCEGDSTNGLMTSGLASAIDAIAEAMISDSGSELRIWSRPAPDATTPRVGSSHLVRSAAVNSKWAVLRGRRG
jgi:hypothetical protein